VLDNSLLDNWQGRIKFVDDATALEIVPRCSPSLLPLVVDEVINFASWNGTQSKKMQGDVDIFPQVQCVQFSFHFYLRSASGKSSLIQAAGC
jgi:hypothetical protein